MNAGIHFFCFKSSSHKQRKWYQITVVISLRNPLNTVLTTHNRFFITLSFFGRISYCPVARLALCFESHLRIRNGQVLPAEFHKITQIHQNDNIPSCAIFKKTVLSMLLAHQEIALQIRHPYFSNDLKVNQTQIPCPKSLTCKHLTHRPTMVWAASSHAYWRTREVRYKNYKPLKCGFQATNQSE